MIAQAFITTSAVFLGMGLNYLFHFFMTRLLSPSLYGEISILIGFLTIILVPTGSIQTVLTREIAKLEKRGNERVIVGLIRRYLRSAFLVGLTIALVLFSSSYMIAKIFKDDQLISSIQLLSLGIPFLFLLPIFKAYYQGREKVFTLSGILAVEPLIKLVFGVGLVLIGFGLSGATLSLIAGPIILVFLLLPRTIKMTSFPNYSIKLKKSFFLILLTSISLMIFFYLDLFFVRYYLGSEQAGYYNVASITSKVLSYATGGVVLVFLPKSSKLSIKKERGKIKTLLLKSIAFITPIFIVFVLFPKEIISIFYTEKYLFALGSFTILTFGMFIFSIFQILLSFFWSQNSERFPLVLSITATLIDFLLLNYFIPIKGIEGAAIATTLSSLVFLLPSIFVVRGMLI
ncbi:MAG: oligosaccharide flippase family protein [Candidatus Aenigmatarchaeota archaeon]